MNDVHCDNNHIHIHTHTLSLTGAKEFFGIEGIDLPTRILCRRYAYLYVCV
jgi:hypothetical protein